MTDPETCAATVFVGDDRYGGWTNRCTLPAGHEGAHSTPLAACRPPARMVWSGSFGGKQ